MKRLFMLLCLISTPALAENLICFGDSTTEGTPGYLQSTDTFCYKMATATGRTPVNLGHGGDTSTEGLERIDSVLQTAGSCVTVMFGVVDYLLPVPAQTYDRSVWWTEPKPSLETLANFTASMTAIVQKILAAGKDVTLITPWPAWGTSNLIQGAFFEDVVKGIGAIYGIPVLDAANIMRKKWWNSAQWLDDKEVGPHPDLYQYIYNDHHPNPLGHTEIANLCNLPGAFRACACQ